MWLCRSNGRPIRLWTILVSFQPTTDWDMSKKISSPFLPPGMKPFHLIVWWNIHLQRLKCAPVQGNEKKLSLIRNLYLHKHWLYYAVYGTTCSLMMVQRGKKQNTSLLKDVQQIWCLKEPNLICPSGRNLITQRQCLLYLPIYLLLTGLCDCLNDTCIDSHFIYISTLLQRVIIAFQLR